LFAVYEARTSNQTIGNGTTEQMLTTWFYTSYLPNTLTAIEQAFAFYDKSAPAVFDNTPFTIESNTLKWSVDITNGSTTSPVTMRYKLGQVNTSPSALSWPSSELIVMPNLPLPGMTTYLVPLASDGPGGTASPLNQVVAILQVFNTALVDGVSAPINHSVVLDTQLAEYVLVLTFPPFNHSLYYDPSIGLGVIRPQAAGGSASSGGGGGGGGSILYVAVAVGVAAPVAIALLVAAVIGGVCFYKKRQRAQSTRKPRLSIKDVADYLGEMHSVVGHHAMQAESPFFDHHP
jgi:hypothetical protein